MSLGKRPTEQTILKSTYKLYDFPACGGKMKPGKRQERVFLPLAFFSSFDHCLDIIQTMCYNTDIRHSRKLFDQKEKEYVYYE